MLGSWMTSLGLIMCVIAFQCLETPAQDSGFGYLVETEPACFFINLTSMYEEQVITSLNYTGLNESFTNFTYDCWLIQIADDLLDSNFTRVKLEANEFDVDFNEFQCLDGLSNDETVCSECDGDRVYVYDGASESDCLYGFFCGTEMLLAPIISSSVSMLITYTRHQGSEREGFNFTVSATDGIATECVVRVIALSTGPVFLHLIIILFSISFFCFTCGSTTLYYGVRREPTATIYSMKQSENVESKELEHSQSVQLDNLSVEAPSDEVNIDKPFFEIMPFGSALPHWSITAIKTLSKTALGGQEECLELHTDNDETDTDMLPEEETCELKENMTLADKAFFESAPYGFTSPRWYITPVQSGINIDQSTEKNE